jgi:hypothetical protein
VFAEHAIRMRHQHAPMRLESHRCVVVHAGTCRIVHA